jgi:DNA repair exonuclease SbcCD nuclease subunit
MSDRSFCFIHASDFQLERSLAGVVDPPQAIRARLVGAPQTAVRTVFDAALTFHADFVVLTGELVDPRSAGPRGVALLVEQFKRLDAKNIPVYWLAGDADAVDHWPAGVELPDNVRIITPASHLIVHTRDHQPIARIGAVEQFAQLRAPAAAMAVAGSTPPPEPYRIALARLPAHAPASAILSALGGAHVEYAALGGAPVRGVLQAARPCMIQAGSPQGRDFSDAGPHGCTFIEVDAQGRTRATLRATDAVRYHVETLDVSPHSSAEGYQAELRTRIENLAVEAGDRVTLLRVEMSIIGSKLARSERLQLAADLLKWAREQFASRAAPVWTTEIDIAPAAPAAELFSQDTILGEFLRTVRQPPEAGDVLFEDKALSDAGGKELSGRLGALAAADRERMARATLELGAELLGSPQASRSHDARDRVAV